MQNPLEEHRSVSYDSRGFGFFSRFIAGSLILISIAHYGTAFGSELVLAAAQGDGIAAIEHRIAEIKAKRSLRSIGEIKLLERLRIYEEELATRTIGTESVETLKTAHERLIGADLSAMKLYLFENGQTVATYDIASKGKRGSQWETPTGLYKVETKEENHLSSIGGVYMPYSMQFFGNFFVHGWPYYPDGTPVEEGYSGGCIRLSTENAAEVFKFADRSTPIFVWNGTSEETGEILGADIAETPVPRVSAKAFIVANIQTGEVYAEKNADTQRPIASLTKLITALVANETIHYGRVIAVTADDQRQTEGTPGAIAAGDSFEVGDLLYPLLMESNNSVAYALGRYWGSENFMGWLNDKARAIGMISTSLEDPSGISPNNVSTANDLFKLARYIHDSQSYILNITRETKKTVTAESGRSYAVRNFNVFAEKDGFLGGKTGYTDEARQTMVTLFETPVGENKATIAIIVLGSEDRKTDVETLLQWFTKATQES